MIGNRESGVLYVRATSKQHEKVQEFLDQVMAGAKRQVLIEATVAEVQLSNEYQRGIEWQRLRSGSNGTFELIQPRSLRSPAEPASTSTPFLIGYVSSSGNFSSTLKLLEAVRRRAGAVAARSLSVLNNQTAILRVTRDIIYFTITPSTTSVAATGGGTAVTSAVVHHHAQRRRRGLHDERAAADQRDRRGGAQRAPDHPQAASASCATPTRRCAARPGDQPEFRRTTSRCSRRASSIRSCACRAARSRCSPGSCRTPPTTARSASPACAACRSSARRCRSRADLTTKTELVIFLRATVIRDPSIDGDFRGFRDQLPREDFFRKPNPGQAGGPMLPRPLQ